MITNGTRPIIILMFIIALFCVQPVAGAGVVYDGSLSSKYNEIDGTGSWPGESEPKDGPESEDDDDGLSPQDPPMTMSWTVSRNPDMSWRYSYELAVHQGYISHIIIETSEDFASQDIFNSARDYEVKWYAPGPSNPYMPGKIYGIKFDNLTETTETITFDSRRGPAWGDFYAKRGDSGSKKSSVWNTGFADPDPDVEPSNGSQYFHVLVPDTHAKSVPEPATVTLLGLGIGLAYIRRRRKS